MLKKQVFSVALLFLLFFSRGFADEPSNPPALSDAEREKNKETVIEKIKEMMLPKSADTKEKAPSAPAKTTETYLKIIEGQDKRNTIIYRCRNIKSKSAIDAIEGIVSISGTVEEIADQNLIVINDIAQKTEELKDTLKSIDINVPQILVEARIIEIYVDEGMERDLQVEYQKTDPGDGLNQTMGYSLDAPGQNTLADQGAIMDIYPYSKGFAGRTVKDINVFLRWLKTTRDAKILSSPNLIVNLGATAGMITGEDVPIIQTQVNGGTVTTTTQFKRIGVKLSVTPVLINNDSVKLKINPEVSSIIRFEPFTQNNITVNNPVVAVRNIDTELVAFDNDIILIGGLYSNEKIKSARKTPFFSDLPLLGELFTAMDNSDVKKQLVFFLKINVLSEKTDGFTGYDLDKTAEELKKAGEFIRDSEALFPNADKEEKNEKGPSSKN
jgi:type II secretory pathway component GspD/PulD (secretin)